MGNLSQSPKVSVIIPVHNGSDTLSETIQSVLNQTYNSFEIIIVDDASQDQPKDVVNQFDDPRIRLIEHKENRGANAARNTGIRASSGEILVFLDQDDIFHPEKLQEHVDYLEKNTEIGFTYNARFELNHSSQTIREIWQPPSELTLADIVMGHQLSPSDMVIHRNWAFKIGLWDEDHSYIGSEITFLGRLNLDGCKFADVGRVLNYRRYYSRRKFAHLDKQCLSEMKSRDLIFNDPRCPPGILELRDISFANNYIYFSYLAFVQNETELSQMFIREAVQLKPSLVKGIPCELVKSITQNSIADESVNHEEFLNIYFSHLPSEMASISNQYDWAVSRGYLLRGVREVMWGRDEVGYKHLSNAESLGAEIDESFLQQLTEQLLSYEKEFGSEASKAFLKKISPHIKTMSGLEKVRLLMGNYSFNQAFQHYKKEEFSKVPKEVISAIFYDPKYIKNRGALAIMMRSLIGRTRNGVTRTLLI